MLTNKPNNFQLVHKVCIAIYYPELVINYKILIKDFFYTIYVVILRMKIKQMNIKCTFRNLKK